MSTVKTIAKNTTFLLVAQAASLVLSFLFLGVSARYLGPVNFGILSFALAFTNVFSIFTDIGLRQYMTREVAKDKDLTRKYLGNVMGIKLALVGITALALVIVAEAMAFKSPDREIVYIVAVSMFVNAFIQTFYAVFQAHERMEYLSLGMILESAMLFALALISIEFNAGIITFSLIYLISRIAILMFCLVVSTFKFVGPAVYIDRGFWKETLKHAWPFGMTGLFIGVYCWIDTIMLAFFWDSEAVGYYNAAFRLIMVTSFIPANLMAALFPLMARSFETSKEKLTTIYQLALKYMLLLAIPLSVGTMLLSKEIITLLYGIEYDSSILVLQILIWQAPFMFINYALSHLLNSVNKQILVTKCVAVGTVLNIAMNLLIIPKYGYIGAGTTTVVTEIVVVGILYWYVSKTQYHLERMNLMKNVARIAASSFLLAIAVLALQSLNISIFVTLPVAIGVYFGMAYLINTFDKRDISLFKQIMFEA